MISFSNEVGDAQVPIAHKNDVVVVLNAIARAVTRKVKIAAKHSFERYDVVWVLLCALLYATWKQAYHLRLGR